MVMKSIYTRNSRLLIAYAYALVLMKDRQSERALSIIYQAEHNFPQPFALPQLYYIKGEIFLQKGQLNEAIQNYHIFLQVHTGMNLIKDTYYKIGICHRIMGNQDESQEYFDKSKQYGWAKNEADKYAKFSLESEPISDNQLYQLRYATDGGYYEKAFKILKKIDALKLNVHDRCEYYYRYARLLQHRYCQQK